MSQHQAPTDANERASVKAAWLGAISLKAMWWMLAHAVAIGLVLLYTGVTEAHPTPDANIGAGMGMMGLAALGLPWSLFNLLGMFGDVPDIAESLLYASFAMLNLVLHDVYWMVRGDSAGHDQVTRASGI